MARKNVVFFIFVLCSCARHDGVSSTQTVSDDVQQNRTLLRKTISGGMRSPLAKPLSRICQLDINGHVHFVEKLGDEVLREWDRDMTPTSVVKNIADVPHFIEAASHGSVSTRMGPSDIPTLAYTGWTFDPTTGNATKAFEVMFGPSVQENTSRESQILVEFLDTNCRAQ